MKDTIKKDIVTAMKEKNVVARDILRVLRGEIERNEQSTKGKVELSDSDVIRIIKKLIENSTADEAAVLEMYVPNQMDEGDMTIEASLFIDNSGLDSPRDMGKVMAHFKQNFEGTYDGGILSKIVKQLLN